MNDTALLDELEQLAARQIGLRIPDDAHDRFAAMLRERAAHLGYASLKDYRTFLAGKQAAGEWEEFARVFTTGETFFFRDHGQFDLLRLHLLPELIARQRGNKTLRLWSAGCASGEEVYSLAILVDMLLPEGCGWNILIIGTDINSEALAKARRGRYGKWSFRMIPPEIQQRYFHLDGNEWVLDDRIRRMVTFRVSNLVSEPFPDPASELDIGSELHGMDLILCRNMFIYFVAAAVFAVAAKFAAELREGGYLLTAHTELIGHPVHELESRLFADGVVYQRPGFLSRPPPSVACKCGSHFPSPSCGRGKGRRPNPNPPPRCAQGREHYPFHRLLRQYEPRLPCRFRSHTTTRCCSRKSGHMPTAASSMWRSRCAARHWPPIRWRQPHIFYIAAPVANHPAYAKWLGVQLIDKQGKGHHKVFASAIYLASLLGA